MRSVANDGGDAKAKAYQRSQLRLGIIEQICTFLFLIVWVWISPGVVRALGGMGQYAMLIVVSAGLYVSYQVALFVLDYLGGYRLEHAYGLSTETFGRWLWRHTKMVVLSGLFLGALIVGLYTAVWYVPVWVAWCWGAWVAASVGLAVVFPVVILPLFYPAEKLENEDLAGRFRELAAGTGVSVEGVYRLELSKSTRKGNAMLAGLGRTRRVLLGDTILDKLNTDQLLAVFAHELGHHVHRHFLKLLTVHGVGSVILFAAVYWVLNGFAGGDDYAAAIERVPVVALVMSLFAFLWRPVANGACRYFERQSDRYALERTGNPAAFAETFEILADQNLADPSPPRWVVVFYHDHPPIRERIAMAKEMGQAGGSQ